MVIRNEKLQYRFAMMCRPAGECYPADADWDACFHPCSEEWDYTNAVFQTVAYSYSNLTLFNAMWYLRTF